MLCCCCCFRLFRRLRRPSFPGPAREPRPGRIRRPDPFLIGEWGTPSPLADDEDLVLPPFLPDLCLRLPTFRRDARDCDGLKTADRSSSVGEMGLLPFLGLAALTSSGASAVTAEAAVAESAEAPSREEAMAAAAAAPAAALCEGTSEAAAATDAAAPFESSADATSAPSILLPLALFLPPPNRLRSCSNCCQADGMVRGGGYPLWVAEHNDTSAVG